MAIDEYADWRRSPMDECCTEIPSVRAFLRITSSSIFFRDDDQVRRTCSPMFSGKCLAVSFFRVWGSSGYPGRAKSDEDRKCPPIIRRLRIGAKSAISNVRTDTESGGMADQGDREGTRSKRLLSSA